MGLMTNMLGEGVFLDLRDFGWRVARPLAFAAALTALAACQTTSQATGQATGQAMGQISGPTTGSASGAVDMTFGNNGIDQSLWRSGMEAERTHKYDQAVGAFANLYQRHSSNPLVVTALVRNLRYNGQNQAAIEVAERALEQVGDAPLHFEYAKALLASGQSPKALKVLDDVAAQMPDNWRVFSAMGIAHDAQGKFVSAIASYQQALALSPNNAVVMNNLAMSQAMSGQLQAAIATLEEAAGYNRTNVHIRQNLALLYAVNGDEAKAKALAAMDLNASDLETNLSFYRRFGETLQ